MHPPPQPPMAPTTTTTTSTSTTKLSLTPAQILLITLGSCVVIGGMTCLLVTGWLARAQGKPSSTGVMFLDVLVLFFPDLQLNNASAAIMDVISGVAVAASTVIVYEGSRWRKSVSQPILAAYWWVAQFVAIGFATPVYFAWFLGLKSKNRLAQASPVGSYRVAVVLTGLSFAGFLNETLRTSFRQGNVNVPMLVFWLMWPVVVISCGILMDLNPNHAPTTRANRMLQELPYLIAIVQGVIGHWTALQVLTAIGPMQAGKDIMGNPPAVFLALDTLGVTLGLYGWLHFDDTVSITWKWPLILLLGPSAHSALLCLIRGRIVDGVD